MKKKAAYTMKDLGYPRTASERKLRLTFSNGEVWEVPVQVVADSRDAAYADEQEDTLGFIEEGTLDAFTLVDWANNNMNWRDLAPYAERVPRRAVPFDHEADWGQASKEVVR
jgi:hypothetical protein